MAFNFKVATAQELLKSGYVQAKPFNVNNLPDVLFLLEEPFFFFKTEEEQVSLYGNWLIKQGIFTRSAMQGAIESYIGNPLRITVNAIKLTDQKTLIYAVAGFALLAFAIYRLRK